MRFSSAKQAAYYAGLVPRVDIFRRHGSIRKN
ncbi:hypothetical protein LEP1GSC026_0069, partial [Leptospira interrogans str. 2002000623]